VVAGDIATQPKKTGCANELFIYHLMLMVFSYAFIMVVKHLEHSREAIVRLL
jgi:hypothetical protein